MIPILDTHAHMLYLDKFSYPWCEQVSELNKEFVLDDYMKLTDSKGVGGSIFMEADVAEADMTGEAKFFSQLVKEKNNPLVGVVAACRPEQDNFHQQLESSLTDSVCGVRRILHNQPDELSKSSLFRRHIRALADHHLPFDICVLGSQLSVAYELAYACPSNKFVLDHCGNPSMNSDDFDSWKADMDRLATLPHVSCKLSGILANCQPPDDVDFDALRPWLEATVEAFGCDRIIWGSDWPVCNLTSTLSEWLTMTRQFVSVYSEYEQKSMLYENAEVIYQVQLPEGSAE